MPKVEQGRMAKGAKKARQKTVKRIKDFSDFAAFCKRNNPELHKRLSEIGKKEPTHLKLKRGHARGYLRDREWYSK